MTDQPDTEANNEPLFTPVEARILGVLMEKQRTTPDNYPLTLNALVQACNQKTSRNPVMQLTQQVSLRPRERFWDIPVPKIDSAFDSLFVPRPSRSLA
ncbi:MAG: DUF480 domain-containing protein, partial [gamma proteobacterium endosymbiont of Lamellibrachia anaximandri]|nr:DUF480 domain-containing protein [gamma proteobacterium endosymbiont of Lamellibrachia anaximandri]